MKRSKLFKLVLSGLFLALSYLMPFLTGQIPEFGAMLCPMHIPVLLCGFFCGWHYGLAVGFIAPIFRALTLGMPPFFPTAICMAFELAIYGLVAGLLHKLFPKKKPFIYCSLIIAMLVGRVVWGIMMFIFVGIKGGAFTFSAFLADAFVNAWPGIVVQVVLIPPVVMALESQKALRLNS